MKKFILPAILLIGGYALAQSGTPAPNPVAAAPASSPLLSASFIALVSGIILSVNSALSLVQSLFAQWAKSEPGWLQSISSLVLNVAKFIGSNPSV